MNKQKSLASISAILPSGDGGGVKRRVLVADGHAGWSFDGAGERELFRILFKALDLSADEGVVRVGGDCGDVSGGDGTRSGGGALV